MRLFFGFSNNVKYLDGTLLNSSSFSSKVGKCLGVIKSSSYSSSSSDQPPPKTESSLSSRISPRLKSSLRSSARERTSLYVNDLRKTERKTKENALTISALNTISTSFLSVWCSIFLRDKIEQNSIFFWSEIGKFTFLQRKSINYRYSIFGISIFCLRYFHSSVFTNFVNFVLNFKSSICCSNQFKLRILLSVGQLA